MNRSRSYDRKSWLKAKMAAGKLLSQYGIDCVEEINIQDIAWAQGLLIEERLIRGAEGRLVRRPVQGISGVATVSTSIRDAGKKRFVAAHELGHFVMHPMTPMFSCDDAAFLAWHKNRPEEVEANVFAASLLMPNSLFLAEAAGHVAVIDTIVSLASRFSVTLSAAAIRYATLDVKPCAFVFSQNGKIIWYISSDSFPYKYISLGRNVHPDSGAGEFFAATRASEERELTPVAYWFNDWSMEPSAHCYEQCLIMSSYNAVLSMLSLP